MILVNSPPVSKPHLLKHTGLEKKIAQYNNLLARLAPGAKGSLLDWHESVKCLAERNVFGSDGIHPTREASKLLARLLLQQIISFEEEAGNG